MNRMLLALFFIASSGMAAPENVVPESVWRRVRELSVGKGVFMDNAKKPLCFVSAESSHGLGTVTNCVQKIQDGPNSLWLMKQNIRTKYQVIDNLIATYVEARQGQVPIAYYLELDRQSFEQKDELEAIPFKVPCAICHPSGPRLIRPNMESQKEFSQEQAKLLLAWNSEISAHKIVATFKPPGLQGKRFFPKNQNFSEPLRLKKCQECHNEANGVRASLTRANSGTIRYLAFDSTSDFNHAQMPAYGSTILTAEEKNCLLDWTKGGQPDGCATLNHNEESTKNPPDNLEAPPKSRSDKIDAEASYLELKVRTSFHDFQIRHLKVSGSALLPTVNQSGRLNISIDLRELDGGISARSQHAKDWLEVGKFPEIKVTGTILTKDWPQQALKTEVTIKGISRPVSVQANCNEIQTQCRIKGTTVNLSDWGLVMPSFLGIEVQSTVTLAGQIQLRPF